MSSTCCGRSCNQSSVVSSQSWLEECVKMGKSYRDLIAWQKAMDLVTAIYQVSASFPKDEMYGLTSRENTKRPDQFSELRELATDHWLLTTVFWRIRLLMFLAVIGPGFITANVDNDAGGIYTYSAAGAQFGYLLLWVMIPMTIALVVVQEMSARMGAATGKGLSDLIREEYGLRITFFMMLGLVITNFGNVVAEFAGIASSLELFHISRYVSVPVAAVVVWLLVVKGTYKSVEKVFLAASFFYFAYIIAGVLAGPSWREAFVATFKPPHGGAFRQSTYIYMVIAVVGTTIAPWMQFYLQSSIVEKGITPREYRASRWDVILGCLFTDLVAWFIVVACAATLYAHGVRQVRDGADAAQALRPLAGEYAYIPVSYTHLRAL